MRFETLRNSQKLSETLINMQTTAPTAFKLSSQLGVPSSSPPLPWWHLRSGTSTSASGSPIRLLEAATDRAACPASSHLSFSLRSIEHPLRSRRLSKHPPTLSRNVATTSLQQLLVDSERPNFTPPTSYLFEPAALSIHSVPSSSSQVDELTGLFRLLLYIIANK